MFVSIKRDFDGKKFVFIFWEQFCCESENTQIYFSNAEDNRKIKFKLWSQSINT